MEIHLVETLSYWLTNLLLSQAVLQPKAETYVSAFGSFLHLNLHRLITGLSGAICLYREISHRGILCPYSLLVLSLTKTKTNEKDFSVAKPRLSVFFHSSGQFVIYLQLFAGSHNTKFYRCEPFRRYVSNWLYNNTNRAKYLCQSQSFNTRCGCECQDSFYVWLLQSLWYSCR